VKVNLCYRHGPTKFIWTFEQYCGFSADYLSGKQTAGVTGSPGRRSRFENVITRSSCGHRVVIAWSLGGGHSTAELITTIPTGPQC